MPCCVEQLWSMGWEPSCSKIPDVLRLDSEPPQSESPHTRTPRTSRARHDPLDFVMGHEELVLSQKKRIQSSCLGSRVELTTVFAAGAVQAHRGPRDRRLDRVQRSSACWSALCRHIPLNPTSLFLDLPSQPKLAPNFSRTPDLPRSAVA